MSQTLRDSAIISSVNQCSASEPFSSSQTHPLEQVTIEVKKSNFEIIDDMRGEV